MLNHITTVSYHISVQLSFFAHIYDIFACKYTLCCSICQRGFLPDFSDFSTLDFPCVFLECHFAYGRSFCSPNTPQGKKASLQYCAESCESVGQFAYGRVGSVECDANGCNCYCVNQNACNVSSDVNFHIYHLGDRGNGLYYVLSILCHISMQMS